VRDSVRHDCQMKSLSPSSAIDDMRIDMSQEVHCLACSVVYVHQSLVNVVEISVQ
jgi:hypothetical protein